VTAKGLFALIPARGGSKRLPRKNVRLLGGRPLIAWTIDAALESGVCSHVVVSTDDDEIAEAAIRAGASVPALRPAALALDETPSIDVVVHELERALERGVQLSGLLLLQPTSPFRRAQSIRDAAALFARSDGRSVVSVSPLSEHPSWCRAVDGEGCLALLPEQPFELTQLNGLIYLASPECVMQRRSLYSEPTVALVIRDRVESIDIDTALDWAFAEAVIAAGMHR
jgi:CMP-N-acetylneuraminic acid synthetase